MSEKKNIRKEVGGRANFNLDPDSNLILNSQKEQEEFNDMLEEGKVELKNRMTKSSHKKEKRLEKKEFKKIDRRRKHNKVLNFEHIGNNVYNVINKSTKGVVGKLEWMSDWRGYVFNSIEYSFWGWQPLKEIIIKIKIINKEYKRNLKIRERNRKRGLKRLK